MSQIHPRLFVISPVIKDCDAYLPVLNEALAGGRIDCLLLRFESKDEHELKRMIQLLGPIAQAKEVAVLIEPTADPRFAARAGVDGVHIRFDPDLLAETLEAQKPDRIVGVQGLKLRDDAMTAGEKGADYVMFGEPYPDGALPPFNSVLERASWWVEVFSTPCVAYAPLLDNVAALAAARIEFIALDTAIWQANEGPKAAVAAALKAIEAVA